MKTIRVASGELTLVDDEWYDKLIIYRWRLTPSGHVRTDINGSQEFMHRIIFCPPKGLVIDHIDRNPLNNQKSNLRHVTRGQNARNTVPRKGCVYKGINRRGSRWVAQANKNGKKIYLGTFDTQEEAALAYDRYAENNLDGIFYRNFEKDEHGKVGNL